MTFKHWPYRFVSILPIWQHQAYHNIWNSKESANCNVESNLYPLDYHILWVCLLISIILLWHWNSSQTPPFFGVPHLLSISLIQPIFIVLFLIIIIELLLVKEPWSLSLPLSYPIFWNPFPTFVIPPPYVILPLPAFCVLIPHTFILVVVRNSYLHRFHICF